MVNMVTAHIGTSVPDGNDKRECPIGPRTSCSIILASGGCLTLTRETTKISDFTQTPFLWVAGSAFNSHLDCREGRLPHADRPKTSHLLSDFLPSDNMSSVWPPVLLTTNMPVHSPASFSVCLLL